MVAIPAGLILATWWLPWESLPARALGPLCLFLAFATWYMHISTWALWVFVVAGLWLTAYALVAAYTKRGAK